jgi:hypothetical protein
MDFKECPKQKKNKIIVKSTFNLSTPWGFFDGASQGHPGDGRGWSGFFP